MQVSAQGRVALFEAFEGLRLRAYMDPVGIWTVGYGHTSASGAPIVRSGLSMTGPQADEVLTSDLAKHELQVFRVLKRTPTARQFDSLVSLSYNVGIGNFISSSVLRYFNAGRLNDAADALLAWNRAGGRVLPGLTRRREAERLWFLGKEPGGPTSLTDAHIVDHPDTVAQRIINRVALAVTKRAA